MTETTRLSMEAVADIQQPANLLSCACLQHSFRLLRQRWPLLAMNVQNELIAKQEPGEEPPQRIRLNMPVESVSSIVTALSEVAEEAAVSNAMSQARRVEIHNTLLAWLRYAQSILEKG